MPKDEKKSRDQPRRGSRSAEDRRGLGGSGSVEGGENDLVTRSIEDWYREWESGNNVRVQDVERSIGYRLFAWTILTPLTLLIPALNYWWWLVVIVGIWQAKYLWALAAIHYVFSLIGGCQYMAYGLRHIPINDLNREQLLQLLQGQIVDTETYGRIRLEDGEQRLGDADVEEYIRQEEVEDPWERYLQ